MRQPVFDAAPKSKSEAAAFAFCCGAGALAALLGSVLWIVATETTGYEIGFVAIGAAWLVGMTVRQFKASDAAAYGYLAAALSLFAVIAGDAGTIVAQWAAHDRVDFFAELRTVPPLDLVQAMVRDGDLMTVLFYVIAIVAGFRVAMGHRATPASGPPRAAA